MTNKRFALNSIMLAAVLSGSAWAADLPENLEWITNLDDPTFASPEAKKGGTLNLGYDSFPPTFRTVGPNSNSQFRAYILDNNLSLVDLHPNTKNYIPQLATEWAFDEDQKTVYFKLNPEARWSDGEPVTADDFLFVKEFMTSEFIEAPWYNNYYGEELGEIIKYDDHTISVAFNTEKAPKDLLGKVGISPLPEHFMKPKLAEGWVEATNWDVVPNTGAYDLDDFKKGKYITFKRKENWWAQDLKYMQNRFNVNKVRIKIIKDTDVEWLSFLKGEVDSYAMGDATYWHDKSNTKEFQRGYINKYWAYNDRPRYPWGMFLNQEKGKLQDVNVRLGIQHAINMEQAIEQTMRGEAGRLPQFTAGYGEFQADIQAREFDIDKAVMYFAKAGYTKRGPDGILVNDAGERLTLELTYNGEHRTDMVVVLREEAKKAGLDLVLDKVDFTTRYRKSQEGNHESYWGAYGVGDLAPRFWEFFHSDNAKDQTNNSTRYASVATDVLIDAYRKEFDQGKRIDLAKAIQQDIHESAGFVPGFQKDFIREAAWRWVHLPEVPATAWSEAIISEPMNSTYGGLYWIDTEEKKAVLKAKKKGETFEQVAVVDETFRIK